MTKTKFLVLIASVLLVLTITSAAFAQGLAPPNKFGGTVMIVDEDDPGRMVDAPDGTMVVAMIGDDKVGDAMVMNRMYSLQVMEGEEGATITFTIGEGDGSHARHGNSNVHGLPRPQEGSTSALAKP